MDSESAVSLHLNGLSAELHSLLFQIHFFSAIHPESLGAPCPNAALGGELLQCVRARESVFECVRECV